MCEMLLFWMVFLVLKCHFTATLVKTNDENMEYTIKWNFKAKGKSENAAYTCNFKEVDLHQYTSVNLLLRP